MTAVALHPEAVAGAERDLRWVVPAGTLPFVGAVLRAPDALQALLDDGTIESVVVEPTAIRTTIAAGRSWRREGARARAAVQTAAGTPEAWVPAGPADGDTVLRAAVDEVLGGEVGAYVRSHGGELRLVEVRDGRVEVRFSGTCSHCPASDFTLSQRFERAVRARYPGVTEVVSRSDPEGRPFLGIPVLRRR